MADDQMTFDGTEPEEVVNRAAVDEPTSEDDAAVEEPTASTNGPSKSKRPPAAQWPFPRRTLEDALRIPTAIRTHNGGKPWAPGEIAKALGVGGKTGNYFYLTTAARDYGLTEGARDAAEISLTELGKRVVYPTSEEAAGQARVEAFLSVEKFRQVVDHYNGSSLPGDEFVRNTLETRFGLDPRTHDAFLDVFSKNCRYVGIGADWNGQITAPQPAGAPATSAPVAPPVTNGSGNGSGNGRPPGLTPWAAPSVTSETKKPVCFVIMPFVERTDAYAVGFFTEVFASLFQPAIEAAGFEARTAKRQGSDVIQATIVNDLLDSELVLCDLTEHNPNVLFELGLRMAGEKPIALVKASGTNPIFDVDHMLRVESYNPNMWPSTVKKDVPRLTAHIHEAWASRETERSYISILRHVGTSPSPSAANGRP